MLNNTRSPLCSVSAHPGLRGVGVAADTLMWHSLCSYRRFDLLRRTEASERSADPRHVAPAEPTPRAQERLVFTQQFLKAKTPTIEGRTPLPGRYNFLVGSDPAQWQTAVSGYAELRYRELWKGIGLKLYGNGQALEQEFIVRPGGDPRRIQVAYRGIEGLAVGPDGSLQIRTAFGTLQESPPRLYQEIGGKRITVAGRYQLRGTHAYTFEVGPYQPQYALVIDPTLAYSTYLGGSGYEEGTSIVVDAAGNTYVTGRTASSNFPTTTGAFQRIFGGTADAFILKFAF